MMHAYNLSPWEAEAEGLQIPGSSELYSKFNASLSYIILKHKTKNISGSQSLLKAGLRLEDLLPRSSVLLKRALIVGRMPCFLLCPYNMATDFNWND
jgi:hypothetical protein